MALRFSHCLRAVCALNCLLAAVFAAALLPASASSPRPATSALFGKVPLAFEANRGQADKAVRFLSRGPGYSLFLTGQQAVFSLSRAGRTSPPSVLRMTLAGAKPAAMIAGQNKLPGVANYYRGRNPKGWQTNVPTYREVRYTQVYKGVDLAYYGTGRQLEYDFRLAPGADAKQIALNFDGARRVRVGKDGALTVGLDGGSVRWQKPLVYQTVNGKRTEVAGQYAVRGRQVGFTLGAYDKSKPLVIDPVLVYSTYLGNSSGETAVAVAVSSDNSAYVTGYTDGATFPGANGKVGPGGQYDMFVTKFDSNGKFIYSTVLGGTADDFAQDIAVNPTGEAFVVGYTPAFGNFPVIGNTSTPLGGRDGIAVKLNANGTVSWSRLVGGEGGDTLSGVAWTSNGLYICGDTDSTDFPPAAGSFQPVKSGSNDAFVARLSLADGSALSGTYLGGTRPDNAYSIAVSGSSVAVVGYTPSKDFPLKNATQTTNPGSASYFVASLSLDFTAARFSTYLNDSSDQIGGSKCHVAIDANDNVYVGGTAVTANFPTTPGAFRRKFEGGFEGFVAKYGPTGGLMFSTFVGGSGSDAVTGIAIDPADVVKSGIWLTGHTNSRDFPGGGTYPSTAPLPGYVAQLKADGTSLSNSFLFGGVAGTGYVIPYDIALDKAGGLYVAGYIEGGFDPKFIVNAYQGRPGGGSSDAFVVKLSGAAPVIALSSFTITPNVISAGQSATFKVTLTAAPTVDVSVPIVDKATGVTLVNLIVSKGQTSGFLAMLRTAPGVFTYQAKLGTVVKEATLTVNIVPGLVKSVTLAPNPVQGGADTTGTVTLYNAAPTGGSKVTLSSSNTALAFPALASVTVLAGKTTATFLVHTKPVLGPVKVNIIAKAPVGPAIDGVLTVLAPALKTFTVSPNSLYTISPTGLYGGSTATGTLTLTGPAPAGLYVTVTSSTTSVIVPAKVLFPEKATSALFTITTLRVPSILKATLTAQYGPTPPLSATLTLYPILAGGYFTVTDLGTLFGGGSNSRVEDLNDLGQVVGVASAKPNSKDPGINRAFLYSSASKVMTYLFPKDVSNTQAFAINNLGQIVGNRIVNGKSTAYVFHAGTTVSLKLPENVAEAVAGNINNLGQIVVHGVVRVVDSEPTPPTPYFLYSGGKYTRLAPPTGLTSLTASDINDAGQIAGYTQGTARKTVAFVYKSGKTTLLPSLGGTSNGSVASEARAINAAGTLVGYSALATDTAKWHMVLWGNGQIVDLGGLPGYNDTLANDLNDTNQVVGDAFNNISPGRATFYSDGVLSDLNSRILPGSALTLISAEAINNRGQIAGTARAGDDNHAYLLTPLPAAPLKLVLSNTRIYGGEKVTGTLTLTVPAPTGGLVVSLVSSDGQHALVPASMTIPAGQRTLTFSIYTEDIRSGELAVKVRAIVNGIAADTTLTLVPHPFALAGLSFNPNPVKKGANAIGTLTFFGVSPSGVTVEVRSSVALLKRYTIPAGVFDATVSEVLPTALLPASARPVAYPVDAQLFINGKATGTAIHTTLTVNP